jgi:hypothetical protein
MVFMRGSKTVFIYKDWRHDPKRGVISFSYQMQRGKETLDFTDTLTYQTKSLAHPPAELIEHICNALHIALGISYWKLYAPKKIVLENRMLSRAEADFWNTVYTKGLGEFFYKNQIDFRGRVIFPYDKSVTVPKPVRFAAPDRSLLLLGGGKDSLVSAELLAKHKKPFTPFLLNDSRIQNDTLHILKKSPILIRHTLDPKLFSLNARADTYNGHIPISLIYALTGTLAATLHGYRYVIASNEASADYGNVRWHGATINHQWSKSLEFERMFQTYAKTFLSPPVTYFSLLRPLTEAKITELFAAHKKYFTVFSSCNRNFKIRGSLRGKHWCKECPKCAFVFSMLAAFLPKKEVIKIFGKNLFADQKLLPTYEELLGIRGFKPFECVGTPEETAYAFLCVHERGEFRDTPAMRLFTQKILPKVTDKAKLKRQALIISHKHAIPKPFVSIVKHI